MQPYLKKKQAMHFCHGFSFNYSLITLHSAYNQLSVFWFRHIAFNIEKLHTAHLRWLDMIYQTKSLSLRGLLDISYPTD